MEMERQFISINGKFVTSQTVSFSCADITPVFNQPLYPCNIVTVCLERFVIIGRIIIVISNMLPLLMTLDCYKCFVD